MPTALQHPPTGSDASYTLSGTVVALDTTPYNTTGNPLNIVNNSVGLEIAKGNVPGTSFIHKFGQAPDFDTGDLRVTVWDGANDGGINAMKYTYSTTNDINSLTSTNSTDTQVIEVQGLGANYEPITQNATLAGSGYVGLGSPLMRVFRMKNEGSTDLAGQASVYVSGPTTGGVVNTNTNVRAIINDGNNQTLMAIYTIPSGVTGYMDTFYAVTAGAHKPTNFIIDVVHRTSGGVFQLKNRSALDDDGSSLNQRQYQVPEKIESMTDIEMRCKISESTITAGDISAGFDLILVSN